MKKVTIHPMTEADVEWLEQRLMDYGSDDSTRSVGARRLSDCGTLRPRAGATQQVVAGTLGWHAGGLPSMGWKRALDLILGHMNIPATLCHQPQHLLRC